jgi:hypothetical protein
MESAPIILAVKVSREGVRGSERGCVLWDASVRELESASSWTMISIRISSRSDSALSQGVSDPGGRNEERCRAGEVESHRR